MGAFPYRDPAGAAAEVTADRAEGRPRDCESQVGTRRGSTGAWAMRRFQPRSLHAAGWLPAGPDAAGLMDRAY
jgi:hypothetical protein